MTEVQFRSLAEADVEIRADGDKRTIEGIFVPYRAPTRITAELTEEFVHGAFRAQVRALDLGEHPTIPVGRGHFGGPNNPLGGLLVGRVLSLRDTSEGLYGHAKISRTRDGDETLELIGDEVLRHLSIGFVPGKSQMTSEGVTQRRTALLTELAVVMAGAYGEGAKVAAIRDAELAERQEAARAAAGLSLRPLPALALPPLPR